MTKLALSHLRIVLVEPAGPLNLGAVARVMKNMGLHRLVLVNPHCQPTDPEARQMAVHAADVLASATSVATLTEALIGCQRAVATTGRDRHASDLPLEHPRQVLPWLLGSASDSPLGSSPIDSQPLESSVAPPHLPSLETDLTQSELSRPESALIFGPEDRGLSNIELNQAQRWLRIPTSPVYPSLNLAQAVAICCYELYQIAQAGVRFQSVSATQTSVSPSSDPVLAQPLQPQPAVSSASKVNSSPMSNEAFSETMDCEASLDRLEGYYQHLEAVLLKIGYLYSHTAESRMQKFRRLFNRAALSENELAMLRGILSQVEWAIDQRSPTHDS